MKALVAGLHEPAARCVLLFAVGAHDRGDDGDAAGSPLTFALGMYLPLELNLPALVGGIFAHYVDRRADTTGGERGRTMRERGVIIASGFMAGGALGGMLGASLRLIPGFSEGWIRTPFFDYDPVSQGVSIGLFTAVCVYLWVDTMKRGARG